MCIDQTRNQYMVCQLDNSNAVRSHRGIVRSANARDPTIADQNCMIREDRSFRNDGNYPARNNEEMVWHRFA